MLRMNKILAICAACLGFATSVPAFSLYGPNRTPTQPNTPWQTRENGYGDAGGPMGIGEEYRWNSPYLTYAFDPSFQVYGDSGSNAVEQAIAIMNALPPASQINLDDYPLESQRFNFLAQSLQLRDVKSHTMSLLINEMGLTSPENYVWTLRYHDHPGGRPNATYTVIQRNYDPYTYDPTAYINGSLYTYADIFDSENPHVAFPIVEAVDPFNEYNFSSVAGFNLQPGGFFTGLTRDDVGGLKYLLATNNYNVENLLTDVEIIRTNPIPTSLVTRDLAQLYRDTHATTNTPADVLTNYPGLHLTDTNAYNGLEITTNIYSFYTNYPWAPVPVFVTNYTTNPVTLFDYTFDNVVTHFVFTNEFGVLVTEDAFYSSRSNLVRAFEVVPADDYEPGLPNIRTNYFGDPDPEDADGISYTDPGPDGIDYPHWELETVTNGEFYIVPANLLVLPETNVISGSNVFGSFSLSNVFGYHFLSNSFTEVTRTTNIDFFSQALLTIRTNRDEDSEVLITTDWGIFTEQAKTNDAAALQAIYTNLLILDSKPVFVEDVITNTVTFFTNAPFDPAGSFYLTSQVFFTTNIATNWIHTFGNVVTNPCPNSPKVQCPLFTNYQIVTQQLITTNLPFDPAGSPPETIFVTTTNTSVVGGTIYIVPTNLFGYVFGPQIIDPQFEAVTNQYIYTNLSFTDLAQTNVLNVIRYTTNYAYLVKPIQFVTTNDLASNVFGFRREVITFSTNHIFAVQEVQLIPATNEPPQLRPGVDKITFVHTDYENIVGRQFLPVTNYYLDTYVVSNQLLHQIVRRASPNPDILFSAADINLTGNVPGSSLLTTSDHWLNNADLNSDPGAAVTPAGPGVIRDPIRYAFTTTVPFYFNFISGALTNNTFFLNQPELGQLYLDRRPLTFAWASYDGTTNYPVIYPTGQSITNLLNQVLNP